MKRRAVLSAFAALTAFPVVSALAQTPVADPLPHPRFLQLSECIFFERVETSVALAKRNQKWGIPLGQPGARIV
jgi:hypothetical protein